ncbi:MAG: hypothetical protein ABIH69_06475 [bacterium]|nr:hypothetical protein [Candidatus Margulisiibacteriota bacterium]
MKKITILWLLLFVFASVSLAQGAGSAEKLERVQKYIKLLDQKIEQAQAVKDLNKVAELKRLKKIEVERANQLRAESGSGVSSRQVGVGLGGGGLVLDFGYILPKDKFNILFDVGYGFGNGYSVIKGGVSGVFDLEDKYVGLGLDLANYSKTVSNIAGLSGNINSGARVGLGLFAGKHFGKFDAQIGYSTALGLTAAVNYKL